MKAYRIVVKGIVQGIGFRYFTRMTANRYSIYGWVRNCPDGSVEIHCEGDETNLQGFVTDVKKGPPGVVIDAFEVKETAPDYYYGFEIR